MNVLLVHAKFPVTYWGWQHALEVLGKRSAFPPLGLLTLAALLPRRWRPRVVDLNVRPLSDRDLAWADAVLVGGMLIQSDSMNEVLHRALRFGCRTAVGGPAPSTCPELFPEAHVVFRGEAEGRIDGLVRAVESDDDGPIELAAPDGDYPNMHTSPAPRYDLVDLSQYASVSLQYSRGCPYHCEFCDVIEIFGRRPRVKTEAQVLGELDQLRRLGYRGSVFFVDDNFIGNRPAVRRLLPEVEGWQTAHGHPFELYTEASVNLASDPELLGSMVRAGFTSVFVGIETPSTDALRSAGKTHNLKLDLTDAVDVIVRGGIEVMGGFIVGFDDDRHDIFEAQRLFLEHTSVPLAMIGLLTALPGTALWKRLSTEDRLRERSSGDQFGRPNFEPRMDEGELLRGYTRLLREAYSPEAYYGRCERTLAKLGPRPTTGDRGSGDLDALLRAVGGIGVKSPRRGPFWRLLRRAAPQGSQAFKWAVVHAVMGEHMIRYTDEHVLPRMQTAIDEADAEARVRECISPRPDRSGSARAATGHSPDPLGPSVPIVPAQ